MHTNNGLRDSYGGVRRRKGEREPNQLDEKQCHATFNHCEHDRPKSSPATATQVHLEDPEQDQARHQNIHGQRHGETSCQKYHIPPLGSYD